MCAPYTQVASEPGALARGIDPTVFMAPQVGVFAPGLDTTGALDLPLEYHQQATVHVVSAFHAPDMLTNSVLPTPPKIQSPQHLHLTVVMLKLYSDERRHRAKQALEALKPKVVADCLCCVPCLRRPDIGDVVVLLHLCCSPPAVL